MERMVMEMVMDMVATVTVEMVAGTAEATAAENS